MTDPHPQPKYTITKEELLIVEHGCIYPDTDECVGKRCKYHDPNPVFRENIVCLLNEHDVADKVRSRTHTHAAPATEPDYEGDCDTCRFVKECTPLYLPPCYNGDAIRAAKAEREQDQKQWQKLEDYIDANSPWIPGTDDRVTDARKLIAEVRSLRGGGAT